MLGGGSFDLLGAIFGVLDVYVYVYVEKGADASQVHLRNHGILILPRLGNVVGRPILDSWFLWVGLLIRMLRRGVWAVWVWDFLGVEVEVDFEVVCWCWCSFLVLIV
ncbi:hypothetical protein ABZX51_010279 [Aspergillus tubingensis]